MESLAIISRKPIQPLERNAYRMLALLLGKKAEFGRGEGFQIACNQKRIIIEENLVSEEIHAFWHNGKHYSVYAGDMLQITHAENTFSLSADIFTPVVKKITLQKEKLLLQRDSNGLVEAKNSELYPLGEQVLHCDVLIETVRLVADLFGICCDHKWIHGQAPYTVIISFDVDGFVDGQLAKLMEYLHRWSIKAPTFMVMAPNEEEKTMYDPTYNLYSDEMQRLFRTECEIGLHSSFLAHDHPKMLRAQKARLEDACGRKIFGHRSHYYRFAFPRSWGHQLEAGCAYDASLGYPDRAGLRNACSLPLPIFHPDGYDQILWTLPTCILDQHLFMPGAWMNWKENGAAALEIIIEQTRRTGGILVLDWHVHGFESEHFPDIFKPFEYILNRAEADHANLCGFAEMLSKLTPRWDGFYKNDLMFENLIIDKASKKRSLFEIKEYKQTFQNSRPIITSIERAANSFLQVLPPDAEMILDIGCGPGHMNSSIPPFHRVLCCDLDEEILAMNARPGICGDIIDIPLKDNAVDLVMACDVLEHVPEEELSLAIHELERVSKRYLYLQVPFHESLSDGMLTCSLCGEKWHINHHKNSFSIKKIQALLSQKWTPVSFNLTGDIHYQRRLYDPFVKFLDDTVDLNGPYICPHCGGAANSNGGNKQGEYTRAYFLSNLTQGICPSYSEIGVLFKKGTTTEPIAPHSNLLAGSLPVDAFPLSTNSCDFTKPFLRINDISFAEPIPAVLTRELYLSRNPSGCRAHVSSLAKKASIQILFPFIWPQKAKAYIAGTCDDRLPITILSLDVNAQEVLLGTWALGPGPFAFEFDVPDVCAGAKIWISVCIPPSAVFEISMIKVPMAASVEYTAYQCKPGSFRHLERILDGNRIRFCIPDSGLLFAYDFETALSPPAHDMKAVFRQFLSASVLAHSSHQNDIQALHSSHQNDIQALHFLHQNYVQNAHLKLATLEGKVGLLNSILSNDERGLRKAQRNKQNQILSWARLRLSKIIIFINNRPALHVTAKALQLDRFYKLFKKAIRKIFKRTNS